MYQVWKYKLDHIAFWTVTFLFYAFTKRNLTSEGGWSIFLSDILIRNTLIALACYTNIYFLFEKFFKTRRYTLYVASVLLLIIVYSFLQNAADYWHNAQLTHSPQNGFLSHSYYHFSIGLFYIAFTLALELSKRWYRQELLLHRVQSEKLQTELQYLKAQLNPHFLFNCINTIYFQIDEHNDEARESLRKFSELLRYQLYECNEEKIAIEKETSYLESYVDLQRLRKNSNNIIVFKKQIEPGNCTIAPLLLLPFVENAFKHLSTRSDSENSIELNLERKNGSLLFSVTNSFDDDSAKNDHGIGLKNVQRRLDLLYPEKYRLNISKADHRFTVKLELDL